MARATGGLRGLRGLHGRASRRSSQILDPETLRAGPALRGAARRRRGADEVLARVGGRRADRVRDRDPLRAGARPSPTPWRASARPARGCSAWPPSSGAAARRHRAPTRGAPGRSSGSSTPSTTAAWRTGLQYVAWRNNTFSLHVHVGVRGADRAVAVCDRLRPLLPELLAISANSPFLDGARLRPALRAHARSSPRASRAAGSPSRSAASTPTPTTWTSSCAPTRSSSTPSSGGACAPTTPSARSRCGSATRSPRAEESTALAGLIAACVAQAAIDYDEGVRLRRPAAAAGRGEPLARDPLRARRADDRPRARRGVPGGRARRPAAGLDRARAGRARASTWRCRRENGAQRQRRALAEGASIEEVFAAEVAETQRTYAGAEVRS